MQRVFVWFFEEIEDTKNMFRNYLTFSSVSNWDTGFMWVLCGPLPNVRKKSSKSRVSKEYIEKYIQCLLQ